MPLKARICLWFDKDAEEAANFYARTFPDSRVDAVNRSPADTPGNREGDVLVVEYTVCGLPFIGLNGGPHIKPNECYSLQVYTEDQAETDRLWHAVIDNGGHAQDCGWCTDRWGFRWQITPRVLMEAIADPDPAVARRSMEAMMTMQKIDIAAIEAARRGTR